MSSDSREILKEKRRAFIRALGEGSDAEIIMADLRTFCYADKPTFSVDDVNGRIQAYREGRREVWLRIQEFLNLSDAQIDMLIPGRNEEQYAEK